MKGHRFLRASLVEISQGQINFPGMAFERTVRQLVGAGNIPGRQIS
jgi:hypothetical protein